MIGWHIPEEIHKDMQAINALMMILGQGRTSRLYKRLIKKDQIAVSVGAFAGYPGTKYPSLAVVYAYPAQGKTNAECEKAIYEEIERLKKEPVLNEELEKIRARTSVNFIRGLSDNLEFAQELAKYQQIYGNWRELFRELDKINAVTSEDIMRVANTYFIKTNRTVAAIETETTMEASK